MEGQLPLITKGPSFRTFQSRSRSVAVVGVGNVGIAGAYALYLRNSCDEMILVDIDKKRAEGEALDLTHGQGLTGRMTVRAGDYSELSGVQVVVITAGVAQRPGETRLSLLDRNAKIFKHIVAELDKHAPNSVIVVTSNPVDLMTHIVQELSTRPRERIIGTGTLLDTSRFRTLLGQHYDVDPRSVHGYILGEHGDSEVAAYSQVCIAGLPIMKSSVFGVDFNKEEMDVLAQDVVSAAYKIIEGKGYTNLAIGVCIATLVECILRDRRLIHCVSVRMNGQYGIDGVCMSIPCRVGIHGVDEPTADMALLDEEKKRLQESGKMMKELLEAALEKLRADG